MNSGIHSINSSSLLYVLRMKRQSGVVSVPVEEKMKGIHEEEKREEGKRDVIEQTTSMMNYSFFKLKRHSLYVYWLCPLVRGKNHAFSFLLCIG